MNKTTYSVGLFPPLFVWSPFAADNQILRSCCIRQANGSSSHLFLFSKLSELSPIFFVLIPSPTHQRLPATPIGGHACTDTQKQNFMSEEYTEKEFQWTFIALLILSSSILAFSCPFSSSLAWLCCSNLVFMGYAKHYIKEQIITGLFKLETSKNGQSGKGHLIYFLARTRRYLVIFKTLQCKSYQREMILYYAEALMHNHRI